MVGREHDYAGVVDDVLHEGEPDRGQPGQGDDVDPGDETVPVEDDQQEQDGSALSNISIRGVVMRYRVIPESDMTVLISVAINEGVFCRSPTLPLITGLLSEQPDNTPQPNVTNTIRAYNMLL